MADSDIHRELFIASEAGDDTRVTELLAAEIEPDKFKDMYGRNVLMVAAKSGRDSTVSIIIQHGADLNMQDNGGVTALMVAAERGRDSTVTILIQHGADLNIQDNGGKKPIQVARDEATERLEER